MKETSESNVWFSSTLYNDVDLDTYDNKYATHRLYSDHNPRLGSSTAREKSSSSTRQNVQKFRKLQDCKTSNWNQAAIYTTYSSLFSAFGAWHFFEVWMTPWSIAHNTRWSDGHGSRIRCHIRSNECSAMKNWQPKKLIMGVVLPHLGMFALPQLSMS